MQGYSTLGLILGQIWLIVGVGIWVQGVRQALLISSVYQLVSSRRTVIAPASGTWSIGAFALSA